MAQPNDKMLYIEPHVIEIAMWIDEGVSYRDITARISEAENVSLHLSTVYRFIKKHGMLVKRKRLQEEVINSAQLKANKQMLRQGCRDCLYNTTCRGTKHCKFDDNDLELYLATRGSTKGVQEWVG